MVPAMMWRTITSGSVPPLPSAKFTAAAPFQVISRASMAMDPPLRFDGRYRSNGVRPSYRARRERFQLFLSRPALLVTARLARERRPRLDGVDALASHEAP